MGGVALYTIYRNTGSVPKIATAAKVPFALTGNAQTGFSWVDTDSHRLKNGQAYTYFATATYSVPGEGGPPIPVESDISNVVTLTMTNNAPVLAASIGAQSIPRNTSTALLPFTVSDLESDNVIGSDPKTLSVSAAVIASTSAQLTSQISFTFTGTGASRTVTVTHAGNRTGTVTVRLTVADTQCSSRPGFSTFPPTGCTAGTAIYTFTVTITN
jgi:hypothetical protein